MKRYILIIWVYLIPTITFSQSFSEQYKKALEFKSNQDFKRSDSVFNILLKKYKKNLPEELCYHYGVVKYRNNEFKTATDFLNKYIAISTDKKFVDSSNYYLSKISGGKTSQVAHVDTCDVCWGKGQSIQNCSKCAGNGRVICYQCKGKGVFNTKTQMGQLRVEKCGICNNSGNLLCNQCKGQKKYLSKCQKCKGSGKIITYQ